MKCARCGMKQSLLLVLKIISQLYIVEMKKLKECAWTLIWMSRKGQKGEIIRSKREANEGYGKK